MQIRPLISSLQDFYLLSYHGFLGIFRRPFYWKDTLEQMDYAGAGSFFIMALVSLFVGMALSLQLAAELAVLGLKMYIGKVVGITIIREVGPVVAALVFTGRVGAGMASEIGSMMIGNQVDSLRVFGVDPIKKLVTPRLVASLVMLPALTIMGDAISLIGAWYIAAGAVKPFMFGYLIASISCYMGFTTRGGSTGLRTSTTNAVVMSIIMIIISDFVLTRILLYVLGYKT